MSETVVRNLATLRGMAKAGHIKLDPATGQKVRYWTGQTVVAYYIDEAVGSNRFSYQGFDYEVRFVDGCFCPFVFELG